MAMIVIRGPSGVGKTTVAKLVAAKLDVPIIHIDEVLHEHGLGYIIGEPCIPEENFFKVNRIIEGDVKRKASKGHIVMEGNFYHLSHIKDTEKLAPAMWFTLNAPLQTCVERDSSRNGIGETRIGNVYRNTTMFSYGTEIDTEGRSPEEIADEIADSMKQSVY
jgi:broad-specificity NMP kinase